VIAASRWKSLTSWRNNLPLRNVHDFELALLDPCMAMTRRGIRVDNEKRLSMIDALKASVVPQSESLAAVVLPMLNPSIPDAHLFQSKWTCPCCRNGSGKREACWSCAGLEKKPGKTVAATLTACVQCGGLGSRLTWVFNPESDQQKKIVLYDLLKLPKKLNRDKKLTADEEALKQLVAVDKSGIVLALLKLSKAGTMVSILERLAPGPDGRIRTFFNVSGTETGRVSHSESWTEVSTNLGNLPKKEAATNELYDIRQCLVPDDGEVFVEGDLSNAEARVVAALCNNRVLLEKLSIEGFDIYRWTASVILNKPMDDVTKAERTLYKVACLALGYGMGWSTYMRGVNDMADTTGVTVTAAKAKEVVAAYHKLHPSLEAWWKKVGAQLDERGTLTTSFGRTRRFFGRRNPQDRWLDQTHKEAIAFEPQSTVADLLNRGLLRWWKQFDGRWGRLLLQVHDSVLLSVPIAQVSTTVKLLKRCLEEPITVNGVTLTIPAEISVGRESWAKLEKVS
jgi:DNA polymerase I-like protein with 3'-5' exonuclease and polymerase domains